MTLVLEAICFSFTEMLSRLIILITSLLITINADGDISKFIVLNRDLLLQQLFSEVESWDHEFVSTYQDANQECRKQLLTIHDEYYDRIFDAWGHIPSGIHSGKLQSMGNYDDCVSIKNESLVGKYCKTFIMTSKSQVEFIRIGICIPQVCEPNFIQDIFRNETKPLDVYVDQCSKHEPTFNVFTYICFLLGGLLLCVIVTSSIYDYRTKEKVKRNHAWISWSLQTNLKKTFDMSTTSDEHLSCIDGMRAITMMWIMYYHTYLITYRSQYTNFTENTNPQRSNVLVHSGVVGVDTFFCISGFLMTYLSLKKLDRGMNLNVFKSIVSRYLRLAPSMMAVILVVNGLFGLADGPNTISFTNMDACLSKWWVNVLMLQNYVEGVSIYQP